MFDLQDFVHQCREALAEPQPARVIESLVQSALSNPDEVRAAFAEVASGQPPGLITFAALDATLTVADITTPPGLRSPAHDHQMWAVIGVYEGQELNEFYRYEGSEFTKRGARLLKEGDVAILLSLIHI